MSKQKTMTLEEFNSHWKLRGGASVYRGVLDSLIELKPAVVEIGNPDVRVRRRGLTQAAVTRYGKGRVRTLIADGVLYACLMPDAGNSK